MCLCVSCINLQCALNKRSDLEMLFCVKCMRLLTNISSFVFASPCVFTGLPVFVVKRWGTNNRAPNSFKRGKSKNINKTAVTVTRVTFAVTRDRHRRGTQSPRISLKSVSNCAAGLEVLSFLPLGVAVGQMHYAFSETLARIRPFRWRGVNGWNPLWMKKFRIVKTFGMHD